LAQQSRFYYGWFIVIIIFVSMIPLYGIRHSFAVFFVPILDEFGWARGSTSLMFSLNLLFYGLLAPLAGNLGDRWKPRRVMLIGIVILSLATVSCAMANELWHFYLLFGLLVPLGNALSGWPLFVPALANWFTRRRGLVIGLGQAGGGLSFAYGIFAEFIISRLGWRTAYPVLASVLVIVILPLNILFFHYRPTDKGLRAYGTAKPSTAMYNTKELITSKNLSYPDWSLVQAMKTYQLWLLVFSLSLYWGIGNYLVLAHQVKFTEDIGYTSMFGASIAAIFGICTAIGQMFGFVSDWIGREKTVTLASILSVGALIALISVSYISQAWPFYIYGICFGLGGGLCSAIMFAAAADIFHGRYFGTIGGLLLTGVGVGSAVGPWLGGYIYDIYGSYLAAFILCIVCIVIACIMLWIAAPRNAAKIRAKRLSTIHV
jgi:MFS family permease